MTFFIASRAFKVWLAICVDDCFTSDPDAAIEFITRRASFRGLELSPCKQVGPICASQLLGARVSLLRDMVSAEISDERNGSATHSLREVIRAIALTSSVAAKMGWGGVGLGNWGNAQIEKFLLF